MRLEHILHVGQSLTYDITAATRASTYTRCLEAFVTTLTMVVDVIHVGLQVKPMVYCHIPTRVALAWQGQVHCYMLIKNTTNG